MSKKWAAEWSAAGGYCLYLGNDHHDAFLPKKRKTDAMLAAAAPELMEALAIAEYAIQAWLNDGTEIDREGLINARVKATLAIAKATGTP